MKNKNKSNKKVVVIAKKLSNGKIRVAVDHNFKRKNNIAVK